MNGRNVRRTALAALMVLGLGLALACSEGADTVMGPGQSGLKVIMGGSGYDWGVWVDGDYLDRLNDRNDSAFRAVGPGVHTLTFRDNPNRRDSYPVDVYVPQGTILSVTVGITNGDVAIYWK